MTIEELESVVKIAERHNFRSIYMQGIKDALSTIIHCKDCKYFHDYGDGVKNCWGDGGGMKDDDYCSQAKRKDE